MIWNIWYEDDIILVDVEVVVDIGMSWGGIYVVMEFI